MPDSQRRMDLADLMEQPLLKEHAYMPDSQRRSFSKTRPLGDGKTPDLLEDWIGFDEEVEQFWAEAHSKLKGKSAPTFSRRGFRYGIISEETDVRTCFAMCIAQPVTCAARKGLELQAAMSSASSLGSSNVDVGGFTTRRKQGNLDSKGDDEDSESDDEDESEEACANDFILQEIVFPAEVKPLWQVTLCKDMTITQQMSSPARGKVQHALSQAFLYMVLEESEYGALTTKDSSVFFKQYRYEGLKCLKASRTICYNDPIGVRKCFLYVLKKALESDIVPISQTLTTQEEEKWLHPRKNREYSPLTREKMRKVLDRRKKRRKDENQGEGTSSAHLNDAEEVFNAEVVHLNDDEEVFNAEVVHLSDEESRLPLVEEGLRTEDEVMEQRHWDEDKVMESWVKSLREVDLDHLHLVQQVKKSKGHSVWKGKVGGVEAAIKLYDFCESTKELKRFYTEVKTYEKLTNLQGEVIPHLLGYGLSWRGFLGFIALGWIGDEVNPQGLSLKEKYSMVATVKKLHKAKVVHNDLSFANILCGRTRGSYFLVDFEYANHDPSTNDMEDELKGFRALLQI